MSLEKFLVDLMLILAHSMFLKKNWVEVSFGFLIFVQREPRYENTHASPFQGESLWILKILRMWRRKFWYCNT